MILKLVAARGKDLDDVESILLSDAELDWGYVRKWANEWEVEPLLEQVIDRAEQVKRDVEAAGVEGNLGSSASNHSTPSPSPGAHSQTSQQFSLWLFRMSSETPRSEGVPPSMGSSASIRGQDALAPAKTELPLAPAKMRIAAGLPPFLESTQTM